MFPPRTGNVELWAIFLAASLNMLSERSMGVSRGLSSGFEFEVTCLVPSNPTIRDKRKRVTARLTSYRHLYAAATDALPHTPTPANNVWLKSSIHYSPDGGTMYPVTTASAINDFCSPSPFTHSVAAACPGRRPLSAGGVRGRHAPAYLARRRGLPLLGEGRVVASCQSLRRMGRECGARTRTY